MPCTRWGPHPVPSLITQTQRTCILDLPVVSSLGAHMMLWASNHAESWMQTMLRQFLAQRRQETSRVALSIPQPFCSCGEESDIPPPKQFEDRDLLPFNAQKSEMLCSRRGEEDRLRLPDLDFGPLRAD